MIIVHNTFICKPGQAGKAAKLCKEMIGTDPHAVQVLTDMTGQFHRVIMVSQYEDLVAYQKSWEEMMHPTPEMKAVMAKMEGFNEMYMTGSREIYKVW
jgi:hypothetical protein